MPNIRKKCYSFNIDYDDSTKVPRRRNRLLSWIIPSLFLIAGITLMVFCIVLLACSCGTQPAYSGGIGGGLTVALGAFTQMLVFKHRVEDEKTKRLLRTEHDYTNFFVKNVEWNETILKVLQNVENTLGISSRACDGGVFLVMCDPKYSDMDSLINEYRKTFEKEIQNNQMCTQLLANKNHDYKSSDLKLTKPLLLPEVEKMIISVEKILTCKFTYNYDDDYYAHNMNGRIRNIVNSLVIFLLFYIDNNFETNFNTGSIEPYPYIMYYIIKERS